MPNTLILCGGTGAHVGLAFLRLHTLGYLFRFFDQVDRPVDFPKVFLVDQDSGDGGERAQTAWQLARRMVDHHPARHDWLPATGSKDAPELIQVTPLPIGPNQKWYESPYSTLANRFENSHLLELMSSQRQRAIDYSKGMMGSPAIGSLLFKLKEYDERGRDLNHDETFGQMLKQDGRIVVAGSGVGGTGASVGPTLATRLAQEAGNRNVMAVMILNWFEFQEEGVAEGIRQKAQLRNRIMNENATSALEFYGHSLAQTVAAVPVGMPERALLKRNYTSDMQQPTLESFIHAVAAICTSRHYLRERPYGPGLYMMGAVDSGQLDGGTGIWGGTLQGLLNRAATLATTLETWHRVLSTSQGGRVTPALYEVVQAYADPSQVALHLKTEIDHYGEQLTWAKEVLGIEGQANRDFTWEAASRRRLMGDRVQPRITPRTPPAEIATALFRWTAEWIRDLASPHNGLVLQSGKVRGGHWPELRGEGLTPSAEAVGDLTRINDQDIGGILQAFVDPSYLSCNGWPHPIAGADHFRHAIQRGDRVCLRQLELLLVGLMSGTLELDEIPEEPGEPVSLETLVAEFRRDHGYPEFGRVKIVYPERDRMVVGLNSPHTLLCPVPFMDDTVGNELWDELWSALTGASDGAPWAEAADPGSWQHNDLVVKQIKFWIEHQKNSHRGNSPPWTKIFSNYTGGTTNVPTGAGRLLKVYWGTPGAVERPLVDINLPTKHSGPWVPPEGTPEITEGELMSRVPEVTETTDEAGDLFSVVELDKPDSPEPCRGFWDEHLDALVQAGKIFLWSPGNGDGVIIGIMKGGGLHACTLSGSQVLDRATVTVRTCTPLEQQPTPGRPEGDVLYPNLPIKGDYLDLVETPEGASLMEALKEGRQMGASWRPRMSRDSQGRQIARWTLKLRGRSKPLPVEIRQESQEEELHRAHWMVWPRFRSRTGAGWKAYYVYEYCTDRRLQLDTLWLDAAPEGTARLRRRRAEKDVVAYPVSFTTAADPPGHTAGPPLALSVRNTANDQECGLYLVPLNVLSEVPSEVRVGVDFGTSHSVAAVKVGGEAEKPVELLPELDAGNAARALSLHISECWPHVEASLADGGILARGTWLPTYSPTKSHGFLPSELLILPKLEAVQAEVVRDWLPAAKFFIPPMDIGREDLADHLLTDFKWDTTSNYFRGRESELREHYLGMFLELVMADIVQHHLRGFPNQRVNLTFTYPLRSTEPQVRAFCDSLNNVIKRGRKSLGIPLALLGNVGIYDESRAARLTSRNFGEVCLVGDLGGGTLDLFIAAESRPDLQLAQVADSARLGGNLLLRQIAQSPHGYLPDDGGWSRGDAKDTETKLRAWMRSAGSASLFGRDSGGRPELPKMGLRGFSQAAGAARTRELLDRYFRLIVDYMARNLVAYLVGHWYPKVDKADYPDLLLSVQLRGNGWRLRYQDESYTAATEAICRQVRQRCDVLWSEVENNPFPFPADDRHWASAQKYEVPDPKAAPIKSVVRDGHVMEFGKVKGSWYSHTLVDIEVLRHDNQRSSIHWYDRVPFPTGGSKHVQVKDISPPLVLSSPQEDRQVEVSSLAAVELGQVNTKLHDEGVLEEGSFWAPVAPLVWETVFESKAFWPDKE